MIPPLPLRFYLYAGVALLLGYLLWREHHLVAKVHTLQASERLANATLTAERENTRKANAAAERYAISIENLKAARADTPVRSVRLCSARVPEAQHPAGVAAASDAGHAGETRPDPKDGWVPGSDFDRWSDEGPDAGPALYGLADDKDEELARCAALQDLVR